MICNKFAWLEFPPLIWPPPAAIEPEAFPLMFPRVHSELLRHQFAENVPLQTCGSLSCFPFVHRGFCFFNSVAIAAKQLQHKLNVSKILILDWVRTTTSITGPHMGRNKHTNTHMFCLFICLIYKIPEAKQPSTEAPLFITGFIQALLSLLSSLFTICVRIAACTMFLHTVCSLTYHSLTNYYQGFKPFGVICFIYTSVREKTDSFGFFLSSFGDFAIIS